jgi:hypothetical protein
MKLLLPQGVKAWFVDKFSRSVHGIVRHRTVSKAVRTESDQPALTRLVLDVLL